MTKESCISHPQNNKVIILREAYINMCKEADDYKRADRFCAAMLLSQFEYWMNIKLENKNQAEFENKLAKKEGLKPTQNEELWVWKTQKDLSNELFNIYSSKKIGHSLKWLVEKKFLLRRKNPKYKWDQTYQYMINIDKVQKIIDKNRNDYNNPKDKPNDSKETNVRKECDNMSVSKETNVGFKEDKCRNQKRNMSETIPETTTEITNIDKSSRAREKKMESPEEQPPQLSNLVIGGLIDLLNREPSQEEKNKLAEYDEDKILAVIQELKGRSVENINSANYLIPVLEDMEKQSSGNDDIDIEKMKERGWNTGLGDDPLGNNK